MSAHLLLFQTGSRGSTGDGGDAKLALLTGPTALAVSNDLLFIGESRGYGPHATTQLFLITLAAVCICIAADTECNNVRMINLTSSIISTVAGSAICVQGDAADTNAIALGGTDQLGQATGTLNWPAGLAVSRYARKSPHRFDRVQA
jgi:hypothetical protein